MKKKIKDLGYRSDNAIFSVLDIFVEKVLEGAAEYTKPKKTITRDEIVAYLAVKNIKI